MTLNEYQMQAHGTAVYKPEDGLMYSAVALAGEVGEYCNKIKKVVRDHNKEVSPDVLLQLDKELGGILWYLAECCTVLGLTFDGIARRNLALLEDRKARGVLHGSGDDR